MGNGVSGSLRKLPAGRPVSISSKEDCLRAFVASRQAIKESVGQQSSELGKRAYEALSEFDQLTTKPIEMNGMDSGFLIIGGSGNCYFGVGVRDNSVARVVVTMHLFQGDANPEVLLLVESVLLRVGMDMLDPGNSKFNIFACNDFYKTHAADELFHQNGFQMSNPFLNAGGVSMVYIEKE
jgi:hypothetical protein